MSQSALIDITIGLLLFFLVLSLICSALQEWFASVFGLRARNLRKGIDNLLSADIATSFYKHGLLQSLCRETGVFGALKSDRGSGPSYLEPQMFADILVDVIDRGAGSGTGRRTDAATKTGAEIEQAIKSIADKDVQEALLTILADAKKDADKFREKAAEWFDAAMDRVSGWYARTVKLWLFGIATVVVVAFNADAIQVAVKLWKDEALRTSLVVIAQEVTTNRQPDADSAQTDDGEQASGGTESEPNEQGPQKNDENDTATLPTAAKALEILEVFPIGWNCTRNGDTAIDEPQSCWCKTFKGWQSVLGWLISIVACSYGAPFWFGLLSKVVSLRGSGEPPEKSDKKTAQA